MRNNIHRENQKAKWIQGALYSGFSGTSYKKPQLTTDLVSLVKQRQKGGVWHGESDAGEVPTYLL